MIQIEQKHESFLSRFWPAILIGVAWIWIFWPMMTGQTVVGFRDSAYLYYPLFKWIDAQWAAGEIPLWNPYCNFGMPVVADGSSSVFYPGKLVFFIRFLSYPARYGIYLAIHIPIAAAGTYWLARTLRANRAGATLAAFSFAFGGSVLFQVTNVIYLVSAAWLPLALCCVWRMVKTGQTRWALGAGVCCALMILGGDPQMVYHVGLIAAATLAAEFLRRRRRCLRTLGKKSASTNIGRTPYRWLIDAGLNLGVMVVATSLLASVQLLPTYYWAKQSERTQPGVPANIYMALESLPRWNSEDQHEASQHEASQPKSDYREFSQKQIEAVTDAFSLIGPPQGTVDHAYQFSQPPWTISELLWPNVSGRPFPRNQRWTNGFPGAGRVWVPSIYCGVVVFLLGILGIRFWGRNRRQVWLTWLMVFFALASFGWYGGVWLINEVFYDPQHSSPLGPQVGGIYWVMNMVLPKYFVFRYPAKLFVIAGLAMSLLAGIQLRSVGLIRWSHLLLVVLVLSASAIGNLFLFFDARFHFVPDDVLFGPFDAQGAESLLWISLVQPCVLMTVIYLIGCVVKRLVKNGKTENRIFLLVIVMATVVDVIFANRWMVPQVDSKVFESRALVHQRLDELGASKTDASPVVIWRSREKYLEPLDWQNQISNERLSEIVTWQRESLYPKHHLDNEVMLIGSFSSIWPRIYENYLRDFEWYFKSPVDQSKEPNSNPQSRVAIVGSDENGRIRIDETAPANLSLCWLGEIQSADIPSLNSEPELGLRITQFKANRFVVQVSTNRPRELFFSRIAVAGWAASVRDLANDEVNSVEVLVDREFGTLSIVLDRPGAFEVKFSYRPTGFWVGAWVSGFAWTLLLSGIVVFVFQKRTRSR